MLTFLKQMIYTERNIKMLKRSEIRIRDPFILTDEENGCYYMYGTTALADNSISAFNSFSVYRTEDLENFEEPKVVFDGGKTGFWADRDFWAPEVHKYNGRYYMFGSCKADGRCRGTQIFVCDAPDGDFSPISKDPATPYDWECLDGTFWVENGVPYIVFSHEWLQVKDGEMWAMPLTDDLTSPSGNPFMLFSASQVKGVDAIRDGTCYVTDAPFFYREDGKLKMIWSSMYGGRYAVLGAESDNGLLSGNWTHTGSMFDFDGGHAMIFRSLNGKRMLSLHAPNTHGKERAAFFEF